MFINLRIGKILREIFSVHSLRAVNVRHYCCYFLNFLAKRGRGLSFYTGTSSLRVGSPNRLVNMVTGYQGHMAFYISVTISGDISHNLSFATIHL